MAAPTRHGLTRLAAGRDPRFSPWHSMLGSATLCTHWKPDLL